MSSSARDVGTNRHNFVILEVVGYQPPLSLMNTYPKHTTPTYAQNPTIAPCFFSICAVILDHIDWLLSVVVHLEEVAGAV